MLNIDLIDYKKNKKFDLIYLDFKGNISNSLLEILVTFVQNNSHSGTIFYLNLQMARETREISDSYDNLEVYLKSELNHISKENKERVEFITNVKKMANRLSNEAFIIEYLRRNSEIPRIEIKMGNKVFNIDFANLNALNEIIKKMENYCERTNLQSCKLLRTSNNKHLMRMKLMENFLKYTLAPWHKARLFSHNEERKADIIAIMRYLTHSLVVLHYRSFIYRNKANTPFLSILFTLKDENRYLKEKGIVLNKKIMRGLLIFYLKYKGVITRSQIMPLLESHEIITEISKIVRLVDKGYIKEGSLDSRIKRKDLEETLNDRFNRLNLLFSDLKVYDFIVFDEEKMKIHSYMKREENLIDLKKALVYLSKIEDKSKKISKWVFDFYLSLEFLRRIENVMEGNYELKKSDIINLPDNFHLTERSLFKNVDITLKNDNITSEIKRFEESLETQISLFESNIDISNIPENLKRDILQHKDSIISSFNYFLKLDRNKKEENRSKIMTQDLRDIVYFYIEKNPNKKSYEISQMISEREDIEVSDHQIRAFKYWYKQKSKKS